MDVERLPSRSALGSDRGQFNLAVTDYFLLLRAMRARAGDPPRTMTQKVLAGRCDDPGLTGDLVRVKVDQVVLARQPNLVLGEAVRLGMKQVAVEVALAYGTRCITDGNPVELEATAPSAASREALSLGVLVARPGIGFAPAVHLERFGSPARLAITDEPRLASVGGAGMLALTASPSQLAQALHTGSIWVRPARSIQVLLSGKVRPFVCVRDVALELIRRGLGDVVRRVDGEHQAPVVLEFAGPSARLLSVPDRAVLCALAPQVGAAAAVFVSDEKTEVYLRDQRRSKAHRSLVPDPGAPCEEVITVDLGAVDPLIMDEAGVVHPVRELADRPVRQVILGGDSGASLRDLLAAAALLKSKRIPSRLDLLVAPPSRQALEVLAHSGALVDLIATGARLIEPDDRVVTGELYPPPPDGTSLRTFDPEPGNGNGHGFMVASAETLAYAVAHGKIGDPRAFKRPVRVTVPRTLPTDDVLIVRKTRSKAKGDDANSKKRFSEPPNPNKWTNSTQLPVVTERTALEKPSALVVGSLNDVRWAERHASVDRAIKAVIATHIPAATVSVLSGLGVLALQASEDDFKELSHASSVALPSPGEWHNGGIRVTAGNSKLTLTWLAIGPERHWAEAGSYNANGAGK